MSHAIENNIKSLYIHIPWCIKKCPYCDFNSHVAKKEIPEKLYAEKLLEDFKFEITALPEPLIIKSIFVGGGTPSLFSAATYQWLFGKIQQYAKFSPDIEITIEANPGVAEYQKFKSYKEAGINRISLGIQSFNDQHLSALGRIHDAKNAKAAINFAKRAGFENINIDIMHSLPRQSLSEGLADLKEAIAQDVSHISWYQLTIEPNTYFYNSPPAPAKHEALEYLEDQGKKLLQDNHFLQYEISAYCKNDKVSQHNSNYWEFGDYLGIGAGAHGKITIANKIYRTTKHRMPLRYLDNIGRKIVLNSVDDTIFEYMLNTTRLYKKISFNNFIEQTKLPVSLLMPGLKKASSLGYINLGLTSWQLSAQGQRFTNDLQLLFLSN